jgi:hypothetical protein
MDFCNDFSFDLKVGQVGEQLVADIFLNKKIEVKRDSWISKSGNIAIEFESRNKPSGIATSKADYWCFIVSGEMQDKIIIFIEIEKLKQLGRIYYKNNSVKLMGDNNTSKAVLIPFKDLIKFTK